MEEEGFVGEQFDVDDATLAEIRAAWSRDKRQLYAVEQRAAIDRDENLWAAAEIRRLQDEVRSLRADIEAHECLQTRD